MKKCQIISMVVLVISLIIMGINIWIVPLADWIIRVDGIVMIIGIVVVSYTSARIVKENK